MKEKFAQKKALNEKALRDRGARLIEGMLELHRSGDSRYFSSEVRKLKQQAKWLFVAWVAMAFTVGFMFGTTLEQLKDTPRAMHPQEVTHEQ